MYPSIGTFLGTTLRWVYQCTGWRPNDETLSSLGQTFASLQCFPLRVRGGRWLYLDMRNPVTVPYLLEGDFPCESTETALVRDIVTSGDTVIDIGANVGWYASLLCRKVGKGGKVYAFEPNHKAARLVAKLEEFHSQLEVFPAALADRNGWADFYIPDNWISGSLNGGGDSADTQRTRLMTIDSFLQDREDQKVDFIKLDAEGGEPQVLEGARQTLDGPSAPMWMLELSTEEAEQFGHHPGDLIEAFTGTTEVQYEFYRIDQNDHTLHPLRIPDTDDFWFNALIVPESRHDRLPETWLA